MTKEMKLAMAQCKRCGHEWVPRKPVIITCPNCRSPYWYREREVKREEGK